MPDLPDTRPLIHELESTCTHLARTSADHDDIQESAIRTMSAAARLLWLTKAVHDCCDHANTIDWKEWNRNYL